MKNSLILATFFVASASAAGAGAIHFAVTPYKGSDTEFNIQNQSIENSGEGNTGWTPTSPTGDYAGGGSGGGEAAMAAGTGQQTAPMSRALKGGAGKNACAFAGAPASLVNASGIVIGIDAARVFGSAAIINAAANEPAANGGIITAANACTAAVGGLAYDTVNNPALAALPTPLTFANWRDVLALLYGGLDRNVSPAVTDCNSIKRQELVSNWALLFENGGVTNPTQGRCVNGNSCTAGGAACSDGSACYTGLTHAWRRDDNSGTSDVFSNLIGLQAASVDNFANAIAGFSVSAASVKSFGTTPYCNSMNWDTTEAASSPALCGNAIDLHYVGPGGVPLPSTIDPNCGGTHAGPVGCHHVPPPLTYGAVALGTQSVVFPTSYQDNDPIRVPCLGTGARGHLGEDVCNNDKKLGVVVPIPPLDYVPDQNPGSLPYTAGPTAATTCQTALAGLECRAGVIFGAAPTVYKCAPRTQTVNGLCPNNDAPLGIGCAIPVGTPTATNAQAQCHALNSTLPTCFQGSGCGTDGRVYNLHIRKEPCVDGACPYVTFPVGGISNLSSTGGFARVHQRETADVNLQACQLKDATEAVGCLAQADGLSVGFGGNTGDAWENDDPLALAGRPATCTGTTVGLRVHQLGAGTACTPSNPTATGYPMWRKLYLNSIIGFANITTAVGTNGAAAEKELAEWESEAVNMTPIMTQFQEFPLPFSPFVVGGVPQPFCEDFNEYGNGCVTGAGPFTGNVNACNNNVGVTGVLGTVPSDPTNNAGTAAVVSPNTNPAGTAAATTSTVCGNGILEDFEDCDPGTASVGGSPAIPAAALPAGCGTCSNTCRCSAF